jgi:hypothetical protein
MTPPSNPLEYFRNFPNINEAWELVKTGLVIIEEKLYRLELWHSYSNPDIAYYVSIFIQQEGIWRRMPDPPFSVGLSGDEALGAAMAFLSENIAT